MEDGRTLWFVLGVLAVWRMTHLLHLEHGPWGAIARARAAAERLGLGDLVHCFFCLSLWVAAASRLVARHFVAGTRDYVARAVSRSHPHRGKSPAASVATSTGLKVGDGCATTFPDRGRGPMSTRVRRH